jgi:hypothetical protein
LLFVFYQFEQPPLFFNPDASHYLSQMAGRPPRAGDSDQSPAHPQNGQPIPTASDDAILRASETEFNKSHAEVGQELQAWLSARNGGDEAAAQQALSAAAQAEMREEKIRRDANTALARKNPEIKANDADYVFITFILHELPHGVIGLLIAAFFAAALSSKAAELNALGSSTTIDFYRHLVNRQASDAKCVAATKWFTAFWGVVAIGFALFAHLAENLIQAVNILGSIFYGVMLGLFVVAFFIPRVGGTPVFWAALAAQTLVFILYHGLTISYLWYPLVGCAACVVFSLVLQAILGRDETGERRAA